MSTKVTTLPEIKKSKGGMTEERKQRLLAIQ